VNFQSGFNGPFPFTTDGVIVGTPNAGFEEEMQTKITMANSGISLDGLYHENMHQWWGDNVSEASYNLTFFKEGLATLGEFLLTARTAQAAGGGSQAAFEQSLVNTFDNFYASEFLWTGQPSDPRPYTLFSGASTYLRPGLSYIALRRILGPANFAAALQQIQQQYRQSSITEPELEAAFAAHLPVPSPSCTAKLSRFFTEWWDTAYPPGGGANRPDLTAQGLDGNGFHC
jgi:aminopeptidase N